MKTSEPESSSEIQPEACGLKGLVRLLSHQADPAPASLAPMRELHNRIMAQRQLDLSLSLPLQHAGPLHSARLAQQSLVRLKHLAPAYLQRFLLYVDTLRTLEDAQSLRPKPPRHKIARGPQSGV
jgi:hypothetical protein